MTEDPTLAEELRYPIGRVEPAPELSGAERSEMIDRIEAAPAEFDVVQHREG